MAEKQQEHHIKLETTVVQHQVRLKENGQAKALWFALAACTAGAVLVWLGHDWAGVAVGATPLAGVVGLFITGKRTSDASPSSDESPAEETTETPHEETDSPR